MKGQFYVVLSILILIIVSVFAVTNIATVEVNYLFWSGESPLIFVILVSALLGGVLTAAAGVVKIFSLQREKRKLEFANKHMTSVLEEHNLLENVEVTNNQVEDTDAEVEETID